MDKVIKRESRETEVREEVPQTWQPASLLPEFTKKDGWSYRWIRVSLMNEPDNMNVSSKMREGWEPVKHSEYPEVILQADPNSNFKEGIEIGGLLLCKAPQELMNQRKAYMNEKTRQQTEAVDASYMNQSDPRMPKFAEGNENGRRFGKGK
tara:strand:+ start:183 stop:635 length:453 start_codon:yes stop_codon:yes gene_type:complete